MMRVLSREQHLNQILDSMDVHVAVVDRRGRIRYASSSWTRLAGAGQGLLGAGQEGSDYLHALECAAEGTAYARAARDGVRSVLEGRSSSFSLEYPDNVSTESRWFLMRVDPMPGRQGVVVCHFDATDRVRTRQHLHRSLERYELATMSGRMALWDWHPETGVWRADPALKRLLGFEDHQLADRVEAWYALIHPDDRAAYDAGLRAHIRGESTSFELEHRKVDARGNVRWFLSRAGPRNGATAAPVPLLGLDTEITERKKAEQELLRETRRYQDIFAAAGAAILEIDHAAVSRLLQRLAADGITQLAGHLSAHPSLMADALAGLRVLDANPQAIRLAGSGSREALLSSTLSDLAVVGEPDMLTPILALAEGRQDYETELKIRLPSGELRDVVLVARFPAPGSLHQSTLIVAHDVTELASFRRRYEMATAAGSVSVFDFDLTTGQLRPEASVPGSAGRLAGADRGVDDWWAQVHPDDAVRVSEYDRAVLRDAWPRDEQGHSPLPAIEYRVVQSSGMVRWLLKRATLVHALDGQPVRLIGTLTDITTLKRGEASLRRTHRQIRELTARLIATQEAERRRIARELHDDVNQRLAGAAISLSNLQQNLAVSTAAVNERVVGLQSEIRQLILGIRRISHELHPGILEHAGLEPALRSLCHDLSAMHNLEIRVEIYDLMEPLPTHVALCCYRIVQEALHSVAHTGGARHCMVRLYGEHESLTLSVRERDNGSAVGPRGPKRGNLDLLSARGRVRLLGGKLHVTARPGHGMELRAVIPVPGTNRG
jgi:PAS domain S-box-containing protein